MNKIFRAWINMRIQTQCQVIMMAVDCVKSQQ